MAAVLRRRGVTHVVMEASGVYTEPVYHALCEEDFTEVAVINPAHAKALKGHKTDARDCARLAELFECGLLRGSYIPAPELKEVRDLTRSRTAEGHAKTLAVNTLAPYMLTALIDRPDRLIYLSSGMHHAGAVSLRDIDWTERRWNAAQAYSESKLHVTALALTLARVWPDVFSNDVDPGWVPTKMGGPAATGDLKMGHLTQTWLAVSNDAAATVSGGYWYHRQRQELAPQARDPAFQDQLMDRLAALTGLALL
jgi:NAD(P)-dependent dehydrogenase (short-subunit alcohol dehydrogenase family)